MRTLQRWKSFWDHQVTPLHRYNNDFWYRLYAEELNLIIRSTGFSGGAVLETGCGNGALFEYLTFPMDKYMGVDISTSLLNIFKDRHPDIELVNADASSFCSDNKYSLIFSNGVIQYFDTVMLKRYLMNSFDMLESSGILLIANILWKDQRGIFYSGELSVSPTVGILNFVKGIIKSRFKHSDSMGNWYNPRDFIALKKDKFEAIVYGSLFHPYRFSIVLKKRI
ncbi:MAG: class I SAM-dependent methyltransferase [Nitrospirae bacterium]|nr:class I SAM-dependent methyltransferase [Nitrospirota bacterium]